MLSRSSHRRRTLVAAVAITLSVVAACGSDAEPASGDAEGSTTSTTEAASTTTAGDVPTTVTTTPATDDAALVGTWTASASSILESNTANLGGPGLTDCSGDITMTFVENGTLSRAGNISCSAGAIEATGTISTTAGYSVPAPGQLVVTDTVTLGMAQMGGMEIPFPDSWGDGEATFTIDGATLAVVFEFPSVGEVTQRYTRV